MFLKEAERGVLAAKGYLGDMYYFGQGVEQDYQKAIKWYTLAASSDFEARFDLAVMHEKGEGTPPEFNSLVYVAQAFFRGTGGKTISF